MLKYKNWEAITFDDVLLEPAASDVQIFESRKCSSICGFLFSALVIAWGYPSANTACVKSQLHSG